MRFYYIPKSPDYVSPLLHRIGERGSGVRSRKALALWSSCGHSRRQHQQAEQRKEVIRQAQKTRDAKAGKEKPYYCIRLNKTHNPNIRFATLIHELAHLYLGHLGLDAYLKIPDRKGVAQAYGELEAESVCYIVCTAMLWSPDSWRYLASYRTHEEMLERLDFYALLKAAGQIESFIKLS